MESRKRARQCWQVGVYIERSCRKMTRNLGRGNLSFGRVPMSSMAAVLPTTTWRGASQASQPVDSSSPPHAQRCPPQNWQQLICRRSLASIKHI